MFTRNFFKIITRSSTRKISNSNIKNEIVIPNEKKKKTKKKKKQIPKAIREQVWLEYVGKKFETKCKVYWCKNKINCFNFDCGHNLPESKGGTLAINNLRPICRNCNLSMGSQYTIDEWNEKFRPKRKWYFFYFK
jgi:5-methylcytosine-specific restriction endonuclease McrA